MSLDWLDCEVLVTVGTGGVGKTTVAAAVGLAAARRGRRTLVLTIDPARRLADALGLAELDHEARSVPADRIGGSRAAPLSAMMLDTKRTFDELVERFSPDAEARERILGNPIYRNLTDALAGSREYSAMEKLHQLHAAGEYDLIVLDTPPASQALDFLDAPRRLTGFLDGTFLKRLLHPAAAVGRTSFRVFRFASEIALQTLQRITGLEFLSSMSEFLLAFEAMFEGFAARAREVEALLRGNTCGFVLVAGPDPRQVRQAVRLSERLAKDSIRLAGLVVNRVHTWSDAPIPPRVDADARAEAREWLAPTFGTEVADALVEVAASAARRAARDADLCRELEAALGLAAGSTHRVPLLDDDVHAAEGLARIGRHVFGEENDG